MSLARHSVAIPPEYVAGVMKPKILIVDDEPDAVDLIEFNLRAADYRVATATDGGEAIRKTRSFAPDVVVLDWMLPELDGLQVCKLLRNDPATSSVRIIMLTAKAGEIDRVLGLEIGADDYLTKPFSPRELLLRIKKQLRHTHGDAPDEGVMHCGELTVDVAEHRVSVAGEEVQLTAGEFRLLAALLQRRGRVQTREQLLKDVWEYDGGIDSRTVDTHMRRLRVKLGSAARHLDTVRGVGYRVVEA
jgi:DNA-binding response OmpR family regulator